MRFLLIPTECLLAHGQTGSEADKEAQETVKQTVLQAQGSHRVSELVRAESECGTEGGASEL